MGDEEATRGEGPRARPARWLGRLFFGPARLIYVGPIGATGSHAHHAHQLMLSFQGPIRVGADDGEPAECKAAFIPANAPHTLLEPSPMVALMLVDPDDRAGRALRALAVPAGSAQAWVEAARPFAGLDAPVPKSWEEADGLVASVVARLVGEQLPPRIVHPALKRALAALPSLLDEEDVSIESVALRAGISASRLSHLFSGEVGLPLRPYILWLRLHRAAASVGEGATVTEAAHAAGFSDGAHLSRVCRRMFGLTPSELALFVEWVPAPGRHGMPT